MKKLPFLLALLSTMGAAAQAPPPAHSPAGPTKTHSMGRMGEMHAPASGKAGTPLDAFQLAMDSVMTVMDAGMRRMDGASPSDIDASFAAMMVPHHQGAVDMARLQLLYGKDPVMRRLAQSIIAEQQVEIQQMEAWLRRHRIAAAR